MVDHQQPCPRHLDVRLAQYHQGSSRETFTLTPSGGKYGFQLVPERLQNLNFFTVAYQLTNSSLLQAHLVLVLWENMYSPPYPSHGGYVKLHAIWVIG